MTKIFAFSIALWLAAGAFSPSPGRAQDLEPSEPASRPKLMMISWDGAGDVLVDRLLAEGHLPNLAALSQRGSTADHVVGTWPTKTAPSHASLYTGCGPGVHGVTANTVVDPTDPARQDLFSTLRGFSALALRAEPLFITSTLEGMDTAVLAATHYSPHRPMAERLDAAPAEDRGHYRSFSSFEETLIPSGTLSADDLRPAEGWTDLPPHRGDIREWRLVVGDDTVYGLVFDDPEDPVTGVDTVLLRLNGKSGRVETEARLKPRPAHPATASGGTSSSLPTAWSPAFPVNNKAFHGRLFFRLFHLAPDGNEMVLYRRETTHAATVADEQERFDYLDASAASYDDPIGTYLRGRLGRPLMIGGDGVAEERLVEIYAFDVELLIRGSRFAWHQWRPDALFHYSPHLDQLGHALLTALHPESEAYDPETARKLWHVYAQVADHLDRWLGELMKLGGDDTVIALVSDHGMTYSTRDVAIHRILEEAGLLKRDADGRIALPHSRILAPDSGFYLRVNSTGRKGGIVPPEDRAQVLDQATAALLAARDPENGRAVITRVFLADDIEHLQLDRFGGDLYFDTANGYYPNTRFPKQTVARSRVPWGGGTHGHWPDRRDMHAIFYVAGPGVAAGRALPGVSQIDVAPTLSKLLGIRPPADACGRVIYEALADGP